jgi:hypothetical protein
MKNFFTCIFIAMLFTQGANAQEENRTLNFQPVFNGKELVLDSSYFRSGDTVRITQLRFYISSVEFLKGDSVTWRESPSYHLLDFSIPSSLTLPLTTSAGSFDRVRFNLGIDSMTNVSGAQGGDLDPTKAMYWTWQSGYINFKLEGHSSLCQSINNEFLYHLGGYQFPFSALQNIMLTTGEAKEITIRLDLSKFLTPELLTSHTFIMSPGEKAVAMAGKIKTAFSIMHP